MSDFPQNLVPKPGPREGELGIGVGYEQEWGFHSIVWFPYDAEEEARSYAAEWDYVVRKGVRL